MSKKICVDINRSLQFTDDSYCDDIVIQTESTLCPIQPAKIESNSNGSSANPVSSIPPSSI
jgi:hypothetical protein